MIGAMSMGTPMRPIMRPRLSGPAAPATRAVPTGMMQPPHRPWTTRMTMRNGRLGERAHSTEAMVNSRIEPMYIARAPTRLSPKSVSGMIAAVARA